MTPDPRAVCNGRAAIFRPGSVPRMYDIAIVGAGVLGSALACEAKELGLDVVVVAPSGPSPSFETGAWFRLNTWVGKGQHPRLEAAIRKLDGARFPLASTLPRAAAEALRAARVPRVKAEVRRVSWSGARVQLSGTEVHAKAALLSLGWGAPKTLPKGALDFHAALTRLAKGQLTGRVTALVGAGPSALSFLEACVGLGPARGVGLGADQFVTWFRGDTAPRQPPGVTKMYEARYGPLHRDVAKSSVVVAWPRRIERARRSAGRWRLVDDRGDEHVADELAWCAGYEAPLGLIERGAAGVRPFVRDGVKLGLQRVGSRGPEPIFQLGPALDQLGFASWDLGPFAEWYEKGRRLLRLLAEQR